MSRGVCMKREGYVYQFPTVNNGFFFPDIPPKSEEDDGV